MKTKIAIATVSGKAYYLILNELKKRGIAFLSLIPRESVPLDIEVVITTATERHLIQHPKILIYGDKTNPANVVDEAIRIIRGSKYYETIAVGVDPGKTFGLAVLSDGKVLETITCSTMYETVRTILSFLEKLQSTNSIVRVGDGVPSITLELLRLLDQTLPDYAGIEVADEAGTSRLIDNNQHKRGLRDALSAVKIAGRRGCQYNRKKERRPE